MEPNQSANPTNEAGQDHHKKATQPTGADKQGAAAQGSSASQQPADGKSWTEHANLQKVVNQLPQGVRDFCSNSWDQMGKSLGQVGNQVNKLNTTQKVAGAVALAGIGYLVLRSGKSEKSSGMGSMYRGDSAKGAKKSQPSYRSGGYSSASYNSFASANTATDDSRRMDRAPSGLARQNESRAGGSYQSGSAGQPASPGSSTSSKSSSDYSSGSNSSDQNQSSSMSGRSMGYRGSASTAASSDELDLGAGV